MPLTDAKLGAYIAIVHSLCIAWGVLERVSTTFDYRRRRKIGLTQGVVSVILFVLFVGGFWWFWWFGWKTGVLVVVGSFGVGALFRPRDLMEAAKIDGRRDMWREDAAVRKALGRADVREFLARWGLDEEEIKTLRLWLTGSVPEHERADEAVQDVEILEWYFSRDEPERLTFDESIQLINWVRSGRRPEER